MPVLKGRECGVSILDAPVLESEDRTNLCGQKLHLEYLVHSTSGPHPQKWSFCQSSQWSIVMLCSSISQCRLAVVWSLMRSQNCCRGMQYGSRPRVKGGKTNTFQEFRKHQDIIKRITVCKTYRYKRKLKEWHLLLDTAATSRQRWQKIQHWVALFIWKWMKTDSRYNKCLSAGLRAAQVGLCDNHNTDKSAAQDGKSFF